MDLANIIFDLDGTLVDSLAGIEYSVDGALSQCGYSPISGSLRALIGPPIRHILSQVSGEEDTRALDQLEAAFRTSYDTEGWKKTVLMGGAERALHDAASCGHRLFLFTNKPQGATTRIVDWFGIVNFFSRIVCRDSVMPPYSSKAEMLRSLIMEDGVSSGTSIVVGDTMEDFEAAAEVGMPAAILATGDGTCINARSRSLYRFGSLRELGLVFAKVGGAS